LILVQRLRTFAKDKLKLPVDGDYDKYVDVHRKYVVWDVQAAPEFSLQPKVWRYPFVGSLAYRGYFSEKSARRYGDRLAKEGFDIYVDGVDAYSTLGWFKDPLLNTFIYDSEPDIAELLFHELAHKRVFAPGDTDFNEAYATTVGREGARLWLRTNNKSNVVENYDKEIQREDQFVHLVMRTRQRLQEFYSTAAKTPAAQMQQGKQRIFGDLLHQYQDLKASWGGYSGYDDWFAHDLNNAKLNTVANYYDLLPGFEKMLNTNGGDIPKFNEAVQLMSKEPFAQRHQELSHP
jgi:predicted aminopeptidase